MNLTPRPQLLLLQTVSQDLPFCDDFRPRKKRLNLCKFSLSAADARTPIVCCNPYAEDFRGTCKEAQDA